MRIITRPDFDGIVCAVLLYEALEIQNPVLWVEPNDMQNKRVQVCEGDIIANLAYHENCFLWFDHHESNRVTVPFNGVFKITPSAARIVFDTFQNFDNKKYPWPIEPFRKRYQRDFTPLVEAADKIDAAQLLPEEVLQPSKNSFVALSMTISSRTRSDEPYWNRLLTLLRNTEDIHTILQDPDVSTRLAATEARNHSYIDYLNKYTVMKRNVSVTDFRSHGNVPSGNRFLVFSLFPQCVVNVKIRFHDYDNEKVVVSVGHSIFNRNCKVSAGELCSRFGGGGHIGAGSCSFHMSNADENIAAIVAILEKNELL